MNINRIKLSPQNFKIVSISELILFFAFAIVAIYYHVENNYEMTIVFANTSLFFVAALAIKMLRFINIVHSNLFILKIEWKFKTNNWLLKNIDIYFCFIAAVIFFALSLNLNINVEPIWNLLLLPVALVAITNIVMMQSNNFSNKNKLLETKCLSWLVKVNSKGILYSFSLANVLVLMSSMASTLTTAIMETSTTWDPLFAAWYIVAIGSVVLSFGILTSIYLIHNSPKNKKWSH